jgi:hypothetical protein
MEKEFEETKAFLKYHCLIYCRHNANESCICKVAICFKEIEKAEQALQRLDKYEQILGSGRLTDRNYKNTTLDLDSCKPYLRLGELEDIYEGGK